MNEQRQGYLYQVGAPYHPERTRWDEGVNYNYRAGNHELVVFAAGPTRAELRAFHEGPWEFALVAREEVLFLLYKPGSMPWSDAPYSWWRVRELKPEEATEPFELPTGESRALLSIVLVDAATGLIRTLKAVTFSPAFSRALHAAIRTQMERTPSPGEYDAAVSRYYRIYPDTPAMLLRAEHRCTGGE
jgi:hypothetical protein